MTTMKSQECRECEEHLADLLLDEGYDVGNVKIASHLAACAACAEELAELKATFAMLDEWKAPEPSPYFDSKLMARLREAQAAEPEGLWERMRSFVMFSTGRSLRPVMAGALGFAVLLGGGGTFLSFYQQHPAVVQASPTVNDLKIMDNNAQALQTMDQLLDSSSDNSDAPPTT
jgi:hypothetical protein